MSKQWFSVFVVGALWAATVQAETRSVSFSDPVGDHTGLIDVTNLTLAFDAATGNYELLLSTDAANPFRGSFRINVNLFNPDTGTLFQDPSFFADTMNDLSLSDPTLDLVLTGTDPRLTQWELGDRVATSAPVFGNPVGLAQFWSAVIDHPAGQFMSLQDQIAYGESTLVVPELSSGVLLWVGFMLARRRVTRP